jgi:GTPase SAR1 family protein
MLLKKLRTINLDGLSSAKHLQLLNSIDKLRSQGIDHYISLPQIVVCGDQSSGKSSVLEAISGVPFPIKSNLCTRFPIELVLRKTTHTGVRVSIIRHQDGSDADIGRSSLAEFEETLDSHEDLPSLIEAAKLAMGVVASGNAFSKDTLHIEISGPNHPHLTIVDLPGLIHSETKQQSASDVALIRQVVRKYMRKPRTIILAVVSAKNDYANQIVLELARRADPSGARTLGVITKPDTILPGSLSEKDWMRLARNREVEFRLGWHVLRNTDSEVGVSTLADRDAQEAAFFLDSAWSGLPEDSLGIKKLRDRLSELLFNQIAVELPKLIEEIETKATQCQASLRKMGRPRTTPDEQRTYVFEVSDSFNKLLKAAVDGNYQGVFFGDAQTQAGYQRHLRAVVQNLNEEFSKDIADRGRRFKITSKPKDEGSSDPNNKQERLTREDYVSRIVHLMRCRRGRELPGMFDPMIVATLFAEQCSPWEEIVMSHVKKVWAAAQIFLEQLTAYVADASTVQGMLRFIVKPKLHSILGLMDERAKSLLQPHQSGHPITNNENFRERVTKIRTERLSEQITKVLGLYGSLEDNAPRQAVLLYDIKTRLLKSIGLDHESEHIASEILDHAEAYYQIALERFVDDISVEVIETCLFQELDRIFGTMEVVRMPEETCSKIAGETEESKKRRHDLEKQLECLTKGIDTCRDYVVVEISDPNEDTAVIEPDERAPAPIEVDRSEHEFNLKFTDESDVPVATSPEDMWSIGLSKKGKKKKKDKKKSMRSEAVEAAPPPAEPVMEMPEETGRSPFGHW